MKISLPLSFFLLLLGGLLGGLPEARASHLLGCDMTYTALGGNQYRVKFRLYRDCSGITASGFTLSARNGGCGTAATVSVPLVQQGAIVPATPLCPGTPGSCASPSSLYPLYDFANYEATVTLAPGQWTLSTSANARPDIGNLLNSSSTDLYAEAFLDNRGTNVTNTSPQFDPQDIPIQYVCVNQRSTFGFSSIEPDGDSLAYALAAPLSGCNLPIAYKPYPGATGGIAIIRTNPLCVLQIPALAGGSAYTPLLPLPVAIDTTGACPTRQGTPRFRLNESARTVTFTPNVYVPSTSAADGRNKYQVVIQVSEYRRIGGVRRLIGSVRREAVLIVIDCGQNSTPNPVLATGTTTNSSTGTINTADTTQINVYACNYSRVTLNFTDPDNLRTPSANQLLTVALPADINTSPGYLDSGVIGSFVLSRNGSTNPRGTFYFQPSPGAVGRTIRINARIEDNACPVKGLQNRVVVIKVLQGNFATITAAGNGSQTSASICAGGSLTLQSQVLRPDSVRRLAANTTAPQGYTYQWSAPGNSGLPAVTNGRDIVVSPAATTLYTLRTAPTLGFTQGACSDVATFLVRVLPPVPTPVVSRAGLTLTSSAPAGNQWFRDAQPLAGATGQSLTVTANGAYAVQATVTTGPVSCASAASAPLLVLASAAARSGTRLTLTPNPTQDGYLTAVFTGYQEPVELTALDALGRPVRSWTLPVLNPQGTTRLLDLAPLPAGLYLLQVRTAHGLETRRVVRQ